MVVLFFATLAFIIYLTFEHFRHVVNVKRIPIRIHVNGTRGKSSVTRLIAAGIRAGGITTIAKTTGTMPRIILPDGREASIERLFGANIIEQKYVFRYAASLKPKVIVIECMAVNPTFQWVTERKLVKSTISVITNSRADHFDLMGPTVESVTNSLCNTIPENGEFYTSEVEQFPIMKRVADSRKTKIHQICNNDVTDNEIKNFHYIEHKDNVALALAVCEKVGVKREVALKGMWEAKPDPGALTKHNIKDRGKNIFFYNVFAANDPDSTVMIWNIITKQLDNEEKIIILNSRADRYFRSVQLLEAFKNLNFTKLLLTGEKTDEVYKEALHMKIPASKLVNVGEIDPRLVYDKVFELTGTESHVLGTGNIAGKNKYGAQIVNYFDKKSINK
ncbi:MAG: poly-gamma-glutamate synthase PgsB [Candidatus Cloacimonetes bacterium]|nr:poly-gamma-glutamate synthase PgsB [Candidatus Cloacimonadota bacterium]